MPAYEAARRIKSNPDMQAVPIIAFISQFPMQASLSTIYGVLLQPFGNLVFSSLSAHSLALVTTSSASNGASCSTL
jgi:hypothetical protein